jgi:hypothetical protein
LGLAKGTYYGSIIGQRGDGSATMGNGDHPTAAVEAVSKSKNIILASVMAVSALALAGPVYCLCNLDAVFTIPVPA